MVLSRRRAAQKVLAKRSETTGQEAVSQVVRRPAANSVVARTAEKHVLAKPAGLNAPEAGRSPLEAGVKQMRKPANAESNVLRKPVASATKVIQLSGKRMGRPPKVRTQPEEKKRGAVPRATSTETGARRGRKPKVAQEERGPATTVDGDKAFKRKCKAFAAMIEVKKPGVFLPEQILSALKDAGGSAVKAKHALLD
uniref:Uncharacterized protein n=1 Tax=Noctiluca scintillans TaxID=2966 RepID=A0A7S1FIC4_NOCSC